MVTWGHPERGGDSSRVQERLKEVQQIEAWKVMAKYGLNIPEKRERPGVVEGKLTKKLQMEHEPFREPGRIIRP